MSVMICIRTHAIGLGTMLHVSLQGSPVEDVSVQVGTVRVSLVCGAALGWVQRRTLDATRAV